MAKEGYARLCQQIVENVEDAIIFANRQGVIQLWNPGAETLFGYASTEAIGQPVELIIPESLRQRHWEGFRRVVATGVTRYDQRLLAIPAVRKDGVRLILEMTLALVRDGSGVILGVAAVARDVTPLAVSQIMPCTTRERAVAV